ncbi:MAG: Ig-like domain-containing protein [Candidatus Paceibacterota bacterium]|jgi:hypothetical protein
MKKTAYVFLIGLLALGATIGLAPQAFAAASVSTPATANVSSDSLTGTSATLPNIVVTEGAAGDIAVGSIVLTAPAGFTFDTGSTPDVVYTGAGLAGSATATVAPTTLTITIGNVSSVAGTMTIGGVTAIKAKVAAGTPIHAPGNILMTSGTITGITGATNFGTLTQIPGTAATLSVSGITDPVVAGTSVGGNVTALDQFGNTATGYTGTVHFTSNDPAAVLQGGIDYTFVGGDNGSRTFANGFILKTAGERTVTATDTITGTITGTQSAITVTPDVLDHFAVVITPASSVTGALVATTITGEDVYNNATTLGYGAGAVALTASAGLVYPASIAQASFTGNAGVWSGNIQLDTDGSPITVTATGNTKVGTDTVIIAKNKIANMTCESSGQAGAVWVRWTETAQTTSGLFTGYVVKTYASAITDGNWGAGPTTYTQTWAPASAQGSSVQQLVTGLNPSTRYYFGAMLGKAGDSIVSLVSDPSPSCVAPSSSSGPHDMTAPTSFITSPATNSTVMVAPIVTISGTAQDTGGSSIQMVEVSTDGGTSWHSANVNAGDTGTNVTWTYNWTNPTAGTYTVQTRASDWVGNRETPAAGITVTVSNTAPSTTTTTATSTGTTTTGGTMTTEQVRAKIVELQGVLVQLLQQLVAMLVAQLQAMH